MKPMTMIFAKVPGLSIAKSRIAATHGEAAAAAIYRELLAATVVSVTGLDHCVAYTGAADPGPLRDIFPQAALYFSQSGTGLGERLARAAADLFERGFTSVCAIGCDCPELTCANITLLLDCVENGRADVAIGPSTDGGYHAIALRRECIDVFSVGGWSTDGLLDNTLAHCAARQYRIFTGQIIADIDTMDDYAAWQNRLKTKYPSVHT